MLLPKNRSHETCSQTQNHHRPFRLHSPQCFSTLGVETRQRLLESARATSKETAKESEVELDETSQQIIGIIEDYIKPAVAADGGNILFDSYNAENKNVQVVLQGACSGCPSSTFTLKNGIENMLKEMLPGKISSVNAING